MPYGYIVLVVFALVLLGAVLAMRRQTRGSGHVRATSHERHEEARAYSDIRRNHLGGSGGVF